jgi:hypothetical protein
MGGVVLIDERYYLTQNCSSSPANKLLRPPSNHPTTKLYSQQLPQVLRTGSSRRKVNAKEKVKMKYNGAEGLEFGDGNNRVDPAVLAGNNDCLQD